jgi:tetratricopeptide (TPR) repeat protein
MAHLVSARVAVSQQNYRRAESELGALLKATPASPDVHILAGDMYLQRGDVPRARQAYERALSLDAHRTGAVFGLIRSDLVEKKFDAARTRAAGLLESGPNDPVVLTVAGATFADTGDKSRAEAAFRKAIEKDPTNLDAYLALGRLFLSDNRLDEARKEYEELAKRQPQRAVSSHTIVGIILAMQGKPDEARKSFQEAVAIDPGAASVAANNLAWDYAENGGNLDVALQLAQRAKAQIPQNASVSDTLGWVYYKKGLSSLAVSSLKEAAAQDAANPMIYYHLGLAYIADGKGAEAHRALSEALRLNPKFPSAEEAKRLLATLKS